MTLNDSLKNLAITIGVDIHDLRLRLASLESCCNHNGGGTGSGGTGGSYQPTGDGSGYAIANGLITVDVRNVPAKRKRDIKLIPVGNGLMDMALTADGDLLHDDGLETAVLMSLFSDRRHEGERGFWADQLIGRKTGSLLWTLKREKTLPSVLQRAQDFTRQALQWMLDSNIATQVAATATWDQQHSGRMVLQIDIGLPVGSLFTAG